MESKSKFNKEDLALIQELMEERIVPGEKMTGAQVYEELKDKVHSRLTKAVFMMSLSESVRAGDITGFEGKKSVGYILEGDDTVKASRKKKSLRQKAQETKSAQTPSSDEDEDDTDNSEKPRFGIEITQSVRLVFSTHNITRQKHGAAGWVNQTHHSTLREALQSTLKHLINSKAKSEPTIVKLKDAITRLDQIEASIMAELLEKTGDIPLDKRAHALDRDLETVA